VRLYVSDNGQHVCTRHDISHTCIGGIPYVLFSNYIYLTRNMRILSFLARSHTCISLITIYSLYTVLNGVEKEALANT